MPVLAGTAFVILLLGLVMRRFRQPHVVVYLLAGVVLGPSAIGLIGDQESLSRLGAIGVDLLLFFVGMEVSPRRLLTSWKVTVLGTSIQIAVSVGCVLVVGGVLGWSVERAILLGFVISLSSTAVVIKMLQEWKETRSHVGQSVLGILLAQDMALIPMLIVVGLLRGTRLDLGTAAKQIVGGILVIAFLAWLTTREELHLPLGKRLREDHEIQVFAAAVICLGLAFLTGILGLSTALGAFLGGIVVGLATETGWVHRSLEPFRVVFVALFFVSVGMLVDLDFLASNWRQVGFLIVVVFLTNTLINAGILRVFGSNWADSTYGGALLAQIGEFSFVLAAVGFQTGMVTEFAYKATVLVIALSLLLSPGWIGLVRRIQRRTPTNLPAGARP
jgi:CPA2 family monovalent cation:H+ antiporter-2